MTAEIAWEVFKGRPYASKGHRSEPRVTIGPKGIIYLNRVAFEAIGSPAAVELMFDGNRRIIGVKPTDPARRNAFPLKPHGTRNGTYRHISAAAFCHHFRLETRETLLFEEIDIDNEGVLRLPMASTLAIKRGAR